MTVYVTQFMPKRDFTPASNYGNISYLFEKSVYPDEVEKWDLNKIAREKLEDFDAETDYLLLSGDPVIIHLTSGILAEMGIESYKVLKWDKETKMYYPVLLEFLPFNE